MPRNHRFRNPYVLLIPASLVLLIVALGWVLPFGELRRFVLGAGLVAAVILIVAYVFVESARQDEMQEAILFLSAKTDASAIEKAEQDIQVLALRSRLDRHIALCGFREPPDPDTALLAPIPRRAG